MGDAGFFKGTSSEQDTRFKDKEKSLLKSINFPKELDKRVDMRKVELTVMRPWIAQKIMELLGFEDEVVVEYVNGLLEDPSNPIVDPKKMQINLTGFLEAKTGPFMSELWVLLLSAQDSPLKVPALFIEQKKAEMRKREQEDLEAQTLLKQRQELEFAKERKLAEIRQKERSAFSGSSTNNSKNRHHQPDNPSRGLPRNSAHHSNYRHATFIPPRDRDSGWGNRGAALENVPQERSRSPPQRERSRSLPRRDRPRSLAWRDRSRSPPRRLRSRSPPRHDRSRSPPRRDRSRSPPWRQRSRSPRRERPRSPRRIIKEALAPPQRRPRSPLRSPPRRGSPSPRPPRRGSPSPPPYKRRGSPSRVSRSERAVGYSRTNYDVLPPPSSNLRRRSSSRSDSVSYKDRRSSTTNREYERNSDRDRRGRIKDRRHRSLSVSSHSPPRKRSRDEGVEDKPRGTKSSRHKSDRGSGRRDRQKSLSVSPAREARKHSVSETSSKSKLAPRTTAVSKPRPSLSSPRGRRSASPTPPALEPASSAESQPLSASRLSGFSIKGRASRAAADPQADGLLKRMALLPTTCPERRDEIGQETDGVTVECDVSSQALAPKTAPQDLKERLLREKVKASISHRG